MTKDLNKRGLCIMRAVALLMIGVTFVGTAAGCRDLQKRRVELRQSSGADQDLVDRFGLTNDAQDPGERDREMGYGKWRAKPEAEGTADPTSPARRGSIGDP